MFGMSVYLVLNIGLGSDAKRISITTKHLHFTDGSRLASLLSETVKEERQEVVIDDARLSNIVPDVVCW